jgi:exonuclease VII small subunit
MHVSTTGNSVSEYERMISRLQLLARDADAALSAYEAAEALYQQRKATLEAELKAAEMQVAFAALLLQKDRDNTRAQLHAAAEKEWGPDYASRAPSPRTTCVAIRPRGSCRRRRRRPQKTRHRSHRSHHSPRSSHCRHPHHRQDRRAARCAARSGSQENPRA